MAISSPMIPPPSTRRRSGMSSRSSAPVESMTRGSSCGMNGRVTGSEPAAMIAASKDTVLVDAVGGGDRDHVGGGEGGGADQGLDFALFGQPGQPAGEPGDDAVLPAAQRVQVDGRGGEGQPGVAHLLGLGDHLRRVQQRLGRDAADVEADPAERAAGVDHDDLACRGRRPGTRRCSRRGRRRGPGPRRARRPSARCRARGRRRGRCVGGPARSCPTGGPADDP